jgi:hypothetical protein
MYSKFGAAVALLLLSVSPSFAASSSCSDPIAPTQVDGAKATAKQMKDAIQDFKTFQAASDDFQQCLVDDLKQQKAEAKKGKDPKPLDPSIEADMTAKIDANQRLKEKVGGELNASVQAYKQAHPGG